MRYTGGHRTSPFHDVIPTSRMSEILFQSGKEIDNVIIIPIL